MSMNKELRGMYLEISVLPLQDVHEQGTHRYVPRNQCTPSTRCLWTRNSQVHTQKSVYSSYKMSMNKELTGGLSENRTIQFVIVGHFVEGDVAARWCVMGIATGSWLFWEWMMWGSVLKKITQIKTSKIWITDSQRYTAFISITFVFTSVGNRSTTLLLYTNNFLCAYISLKSVLQKQKQILLRNGKIEWRYYKKPTKQILPQNGKKSAIEAWENAKGIN